MQVDKRTLLDVEPDPDSVLEKNTVTILQGWLSARYKRAAFPNPTSAIRDLKHCKSLNLLVGASVGLHHKGEKVRRFSSDHSG